MASANASVKPRKFAVGTDEFVLSRWDCHDPAVMSEPLTMLARLMQQIEVVTNPFVKRVPFAAMASMFGVLSSSCPAQERQSAR